MSGSLNLGIIKPPKNHKTPLTKRKTQEIAQIVGRILGAYQTLFRALLLMDPMVSPDLIPESTAFLVPLGNPRFGLGGPRKLTVGILLCQDEASQNKVGKNKLGVRFAFLVIPMEDMFK